MKEEQEEKKVKTNKQTPKLLACKVEELVQDLYDGYLMLFFGGGAHYGRGVNKI